MEHRLALIDTADDATVASYLEGGCTPRSQPRVGASRTGRFEPYKRIRWEQETTRDIVNKILFYGAIAQLPPPSAHTYLGDRELPFRSARAVDQGPDALPDDPGSYVVRGRTLYVRALDGCVAIGLARGVRRRDAMRILRRRRGRFSSTRAGR